MTPDDVGLTLIVVGGAMTAAGALLLLLRRRRPPAQPPIPELDPATLLRIRIQVGNDQAVGLRGALDEARIVVLAPRQVMTPDEAIRHAAWLAAVAEASGQTSHTLDEVLQAVRRT